MDKNVILGVGLVGVGLFLAKRAADKGKIVPFISKVFPPKVMVAPMSAANFSAMNAAQSWNA